MRVWLGNLVEAFAQIGRQLRDEVWCDETDGFHVDDVGLVHKTERLKFHGYEGGEINDYES